MSRANLNVKTRCIQLTLLSAFLIGMTGCVDAQLHFKLRADGGGLLTLELEIPKSTAAMGMSASRLKSQFQTDPKFQRSEIQIQEGQAANGNETLSVTMPFKNVTEVSDKNLQATFTSNRETGTCTFRLRAAPTMGTALMRFRTDIQMPGKILRSNADKVAENIAYYESALRPGGIEVESEASSWNPVVVGAILGIGLLLVLGLGGWWLLRSRRGSTPTFATIPAAPHPPTREVIYCGQCGAENRRALNFCHRCGKPLIKP